MAWDYEKEYKKNIRKAILSIKTNKEEKDSKRGLTIRESKNECIRLLEGLKEIPYRPHVSESLFFVTESRSGFNKEMDDDMDKLKEIKSFILGLSNRKNT